MSQIIRVIAWLFNPKGLFAADEQAQTRNGSTL